MDLRKKILTIEAPPPFTGYWIIFEKFLTIESQDTNRYTTLNFNSIMYIFMFSNIYIVV